MYFRKFPLVSVLLISAGYSIATGSPFSSIYLIKQLPIQEASSNETITFKSIFAGGGETKEGQAFFTTVYKSSDGVTVRRTMEPYGSDVEAEQAFQEKHKSCVGEVPQDKDKAQESKNDKRFICQTKGKDETIFISIIYTMKNYVYKIDSVSLKHALLLEGQDTKTKL